MFDKKQKRCVNRIHLVTDDGLYDRKAFYTIKIVFLFILSKECMICLISFNKFSDILLAITRYYQIYY